MTIQRTVLDSACDPTVMSCMAENAISDNKNRSYWDIYTNDQIPVLERAIGGALLPVALVGALFGAGCGGPEESIKPPDQDNDYVPDEHDNCPQVSNYEQNDTDGDGLGNACDNCRQTPNSSQTNSDGDRYGDACDVCPTLNSETDVSQWDTDRDGIGNECDDDLDNDGVVNESDNCNPSYQHSISESYNPDQVDTDNDGIGDACEGPDTHGESIECPRVAINDVGQVVVSAIHYESWTSPRLGTHSAEKSVRIYLYSDTNLVTPETITDVESYSDLPYDGGPLSTTLHCNAKRTVDINNNGQVLACWNEEGVVKCKMDFPEAITPGSPTYSVTSGVVVEEQYSVGLSDNGAFVVAWDDWNDSVPWDDWDDQADQKVHVGLYTDSGTSWGYLPREIEFENARSPDVFVRSSGEFVLATMGTGGVKVERFLPNGDSLDSEITIQARAGLPGVSWNSANQIVVAHTGDSYSLGAATVFDATIAGGYYSTCCDDNTTQVLIPEPDDDGLVLVAGRTVSYQVSLSTTGEIAMGGMATSSSCAGEWFLAHIPADDLTEPSIVENSSCIPDSDSKGFSMDANDQHLVMVVDGPYDSAPRVTEVLQWNDSGTGEE